jgi:hypothetical protein
MRRCVDCGLVVVAALAILVGAIVCGLPCFWRREGEAWR